MDAGQAVDDLLNLGFGQDGGQTFVLLGAYGVNRAMQIDVEHMAIEKKECAEGLILGRGGHVLFDGEPGEEGFNLAPRGPPIHLRRMAELVEADVAFNPIDIRLFSSVGVILEAQGIAHLVEEFLGSWFRLYTARKNLIDMAMGNHYN